MDSEGSLKLVRALTRPVVELFCPDQLDSFEDDFAAFALTGGVPQVSEGTAFLRPGPQGLDTTLVAGMFFQVLVEAQKLPAGTPERVSFVRKEAKNFLVKHLAGEITLSQFYRLLTLIEENVHNYFECLGGDWLGHRARPPKDTLTQPRSLTEPIKGEELRQALAKQDLPVKGRRITSEGLLTFLNSTAGRWFRVLDLEGHFKVNKKTAWTYLNLLLKAGILAHNGEKANRARYALAGAFQPANLSPRFSPKI